MNYREMNIGQRGFSLLEVLIAVVVFAVGLLAIASLQGNLMRSGGEAKARTVATSLAEDRIERARAFLTDNDFDALGDEAETFVESGVEYRRELNVTDYRYAVDGSGLVAVDPATEESDVKLVSISVAWCDAQSGPDCTLSDPDTAHTVVVEDVVSRSASPVGSARALQQLSDSRPPRVPYAPGEAPSTISIDLRDGSKRESPEPDLTTTRKGSEDSEDLGVNTITRLIATTYNTLASGEVTVQRQEFLAANCTCQFDGTGEGNTPVVWDGDDWVGREKVEKPVGVSTLGSNAGNQRKVLCGDCCRDHHDAPSNTTFEYSYDIINDAGEREVITADLPVSKYNPFRDAGKSGNHDHFNGSLERVTSGTYLEACRFVRVDGDLILTTDFRLENLKVLPAQTDRFSDDDDRQPFHAWIEGYQRFVQDFVETYAEVVAGGSIDYPSETPARDDPETGDVEEGPLPHGLDDPYNLPTTDETPNNNETRTLVARALYVDFLHSILQDRIKCRSGSGTNCRERDKADDDGNFPPVLPLIPFWEVNVALQANWAEVGPRPLVVSVSDDPVSDGGSYSRGEVTRSEINGERTDVVATIEQGNIGLTDTHDVAPFDCQDPDRLFRDQLRYFGNGSAAVAGHTVSGCFVIDSDLVQENIIAPSDIEVTDAFGNDCSGTLGDSFYQCEIKAADTDPGDNVIVVTGYTTKDVNSKVCLGPLADGGFEGGTVANDGTRNETTTFDFGANDQDWDLNMQIVRQPGDGSSLNCPPGQLK